MTKLSKVAWALLAIPAFLVAQQKAPLFPYSREVRSASPGWTRIKLPLDLLRKLGAGSSGCEITDPSGRAVALFPLDLSPPQPPRSQMVQLSGLEEVQGGWRADADLGTEAPRHRRLLLDIPGRGLAEGVTLEGSADGSIWRTLARGSLFRLSYSGAVEKTLLEYPPTRDRYLRLFWPAAAGFPHWREVRVEDWPDSEDAGIWVEEPVEIVQAPAPSGGVRWRLELPADWGTGGTLTLQTDIASPLTAGLLAAHEGYFETRSETVLMPGSPCILSLPAGTYPGGPFLSLNAGEFATPSVASARIRYPARYLIFMASDAGVYTLRYGAMGVAVPRPSRLAVPSPPSFLQDAVLGPEVAHPLPGLPSSSLASGGPLPDGRFAFKRPIPNSGTAPLELVCLALPEDLYALSREDMADVRIGWNGRQVPYVLGTPADGVAAVVLEGQNPAPAKRGTSRLRVDLANARLPLTSLELRAPSSPFTREITVEALGKTDSPGGFSHDDWRPLVRATWACPGVSDLPAQCRIPLGPAPGKSLRITFADRDNAPLKNVDVVVWRRRHEVVFPWPGEGAVDLLAGSPKLQAPIYDLASLREDLLSRPALAISMEPSGTSPAAPEDPSAASVWFRSNARWVLLGTLGVAAAVLLLILGRTIRHPPGPESQGSA